MLTMIETVIGEFGQTLHRLRREWGFVTAFVVTLALGVGANGAIFIALNAYLLRPLPYPHSGQLANLYVGSHVLPFPKGITSAYASQYLGKAPGIASWGLYQGGTEGGTATVLSNGEPRNVGAVSVTASLFKTLGVHPLLGHWIDPVSNRPGGPREVVVSYHFWQSALGARPNGIGQLLKIDDKQYTVVGVMPRSFNFPNRSIQLWRSLVLTSAELSPARLSQFNWNTIVRRASGVSPRALHTALTVQLERFTARFPQLRTFKPYIGIIPLRQWFGGATGGRLLLLQLGAILLLVLAAANLGNLSLARMLRRRHELDLRITFGASRLSLFRLTLLETLMLGIVVAIFGWFLSWIGAEAFAHFGIASSDTAFAIGAGGSVTIFDVLLSLVVSFIALSAPLGMIRFRHPTALPQFSGRDATGAKRSYRTQKGLSVVQIALAVMFLSTASLVGLSLQWILDRDPGFNPDHLTVAAVKPTGSVYKSYRQTINDWRATQSAVATLPGVRVAGVGEGVPFTGAGPISAFHVAGKGTSANNRGLTARILVAGPGLLKTLDVRLLHGHLLNAVDVQNDTHVVVVDATLAKGLFSTANVVGRHIRSKDLDLHIVGVVAPIKDQFAHYNSNFHGWVIAPASKTAYWFWTLSPVDIVMRSPLPTRTVVSELNSVLSKTLPGVAITQVSSMHALIGKAAQGTSGLATLLVAFGILAFVVTSVGMYGAATQLTHLRRRELAIRLVLGARPWQIEWLVLVQGLKLWALGAALGIGFAFLFTHFLNSEIYGASLFSPAAYIVPTLILGVVVALAFWLPARRVHRTSLAETLNPQ